MEMMSDPDLRISRPRQLFTGALPLEYRSGDVRGGGKSCLYPEDKPE